MAGRFGFQKIFSVTFRSTSLLAAQASGAARAAAPVVPCSSAARFLNTVACSHSAAKTGWLTTRMSSAIINHKKLAFVNSVGTKQTFSSSASNWHKYSWEAILAAWKARGAAWVARKGAGRAAYDSTEFPTIVISMGAFVLISLIPTPSDRGKSGSYYNQRSFFGCSGCCQCLAGGSKS